ICHSSSNINFIVDRIMTHEIGHQFAVGHSWNNCPGILEQLSSENAYEPGSGSTIMSYAGSCGSQNISFNSETYYNIGSLIRFTFHARQGNGATCGTELPTDNHF
ncbi:M12 family metallo-peptidase, partial [Arthrospira platensis SPKY1]|nr:M12 family metallo-peptidase [Arthrospira platensis SPKY1]